MNGQDWVVGSARDISSLWTFPLLTVPLHGNEEDKKHGSFRNLSHDTYPQIRYPMSSLQWLLSATQLAWSCIVLSILPNEEHGVKQAHVRPSVNSLGESMGRDSLWLRAYCHSVEKSFGIGFRHHLPMRGCKREKIA